MYFIKSSLNLGFYKEIYKLFKLSSLNDSTYLNEYYHFLVLNENKDEIIDNTLNKKEKVLNSLKFLKI